MNVLGIGPAELLLVFIIALIFLGPDKLPQLARTLGKAMRELRRMSLEVAAEFTKELRDVEALSREVKETTDTIKQAADIKGTLVEPVKPALPSEAPRRGSGQGSEQRTAGESREEARKSDVQGTTAQVEAEEEAPSEIEKPAKENETEDHE
jgi:Tat protein translocase TatB subunit